MKVVSKNSVFFYEENDTSKKYIRLFYGHLAQKHGEGIEPTYLTCLPNSLPACAVGTTLWVGGGR